MDKIKMGKNGMIKVGIGQIIELIADFEVKGYSGKVTIPKGSTFQVLSGNTIAFNDGKLMVMPVDLEIDGYSAKGISKTIFRNLNNSFPLDEMLDDFDIKENDFEQEIINALEGLNFYDCTGNIS